MEEDEGMTFWPMLSYPDIFNFLMFYPSKLGKVIVKHTVTVNQDGFNLYNTIIFQEVNTVSSEANVENLSQQRIYSTNFG